MTTYLWAYLMTFMLTVFPPASGRSVHRLREMSAIAWDIASTTDCGPLECLELATIPRWESGYERSARGQQGERGAWQVKGCAKTDPCGARVALSRLRAQGIFGYMGCAGHEDDETCRTMAANRTEPAEDWLEDHPYLPAVKLRDDD